jgi:exonuclease SbcC
MRSTVRELGVAHDSAAREAQRLREDIGRGERAATLDGKLSALDGAEQAVGAALAEWHALSAQRSLQLEAIAHDTEHRDAVLAGERQAACPTCKRAYDAGELDRILADYERDLEAARNRVRTFDDALDECEKTGARLRERANERVALAADRRALGEVPSGLQVATLREQLAARDAEATRLADARERDEGRLTQLSKSQLDLRAQAQAAAEHNRQIAALEAQRRQAENEAQLFAEQIASIDTNGYELDAHTRLRAELVEAHAAGQRCAVLQSKADGLDLLRRRLDEQIRVAAAAATHAAELRAAVEEVAIGADQLRAAEEFSRQADHNVEAAQVAVVEAHRRAARYAEAIQAANTRLKEADERTAQLRQERVELRLQSEVAEALASFREDASRRARPTLEHETGILLGQTTRQRYNSVQLTDSYLLEIIDGDSAHPLRRFSGGEQDLAALCLRLALSRTLARQRGVATGFILLDEVFGSQDPDRRRALLEQLHVIADSEFRQVFVVSHTEDVVEHCDLTIEVERIGVGVSGAVGPRR